MEERKIRALFTFEILGKPPEHIKTTMGELMDKLAEIPGVEIDKKKVHEPKPIEDEKAKGFFTTFGEVEIIGKDIETIILVVFHSMPSHVEIIDPQDFKFKNFDLSSLLSGLTVKLHRYDEIAKVSIMERNVLVSKLNEMQKKINELEGIDNKKDNELEKADDEKSKDEKPKKKNSKKKDKKSEKK